MKRKTEMHITPLFGILVLTALLVTSASAAPMESSVTLTIINTDVKPLVIPNALIAVTDLAGNRPMATTGSNGQAYFTAVAGTWTATICATGYVTKTETWSIPAGSSSKTVNLVATPSVTLTVTNDGGASSITSSSARMNAQITSTGGSNPLVTIYCGPIDGGTDPGSWAAHTAPVVSPLGRFLADYGGLNPGTTYYYRCYASNSAGSSWASSTTSFKTLSGISAPTVTNDGGASSITAKTTTTSSQASLSREAAQATLPLEQVQSASEPESTVPFTVKISWSGALIPNALITVQDGAGTTIQATTNSAGQASITGVSGTWQYSVSASGYVTSTGTWQIAPTHVRNNVVVHLQEVSLSPENSAQAIVQPDETDKAKRHRGG